MATETMAHKTSSGGQMSVGGAGLVGGTTAGDFLVMIVACGYDPRGEGLVYAISMTQPVQSWTVLRNQQDFEAVGQALAPVVPKCPVVNTFATASDALATMVKARNDLQEWLSALLMHPGARESAEVRNFLTLGANIIPPQYQGVAWTQFHAIPPVAPPQSPATAAQGGVASATATSHAPSDGHDMDDMDMDYMFWAGDDAPAHAHDDHDEEDVDDEDYIPSASERYQPTNEPVTDEDEMDILQLAGGEVEMIEDIGSLAQSMGASHLGRSLQLQAEMFQHPGAQANTGSTAALPGVGLALRQPTLGLHVGAAPSNSGAGQLGGIGGAMAQAQDQFNRKTPQSAPRLDSFKMIKVIGKGSFGKVFLVREIKTGEIFALKVLRKDNIVKRNQVEHTKTERSVLGYVKHPFIVGMNMAFQSKDKLYFVLDYCAGGELFFHLGKLGKFPEVRARFYAAEIVLAISYVHSLDIVYRDLKPENVLLDDQGHIRLTDFGLSKEGISNSSSGANSFCGTPEYLAPEILNRQGHGAAVDWWSLGALLYEMLTGLPPFYCQDRERLFEKIRHSELHYPASVSAPAKHMLRGLLTKDPTKRLGSGPEDAEEIKRHEFFKEINWDKLFRGELTPPWRPSIAGSLDTSQFDKEFTNMPVFTPQSMHRLHGLGTTPTEDLFKGFTFTDRGVLHGRTKEI